MSYNAIKAGKLQDYIEHNDGSYTEVWELDSEIYFCLWLPRHTSALPSTITKFK